MWITTRLATRTPPAEHSFACTACCTGNPDGNVRTCVSQALRRLSTARDAVLRQLSVQDAFIVAKRSLINQVRLRSVVELVHAGDDENGDTPATSFGRWEKRRRISQFSAYV